MSGWKLINKTYIYDGTFNGFLNIVFECFCNKIIPSKISSIDNYVPNFLDNIYNVNTNEEKAKRVFNGIYNSIGYDAIYNSFYAFLSNNIEKEINILKYICNGFEIGPKINNKITISYVLNVINMRKRTLSECHRLKGLLRFVETENGIFYASIHPDNNILEPLGHHFIRRLCNQNFLIHDKNHNLCFLYSKNNYQIVDDKSFIMPKISNDEEKMQKLWQTFFDTISIKERKNPRCQMQFMPKKYWKDLIEKPY